MSVLSKLLRTTFTLIFCSLVLAGGSGHAEEAPLDTNRARLLGHILHQQLSSQHYNQTITDDRLSRTAFDLYLKQLDPQKRFLLQRDVEALNAYREEIDSAIRRGRLDLPLTARDLLQLRIEQIQTMTAEILQQPLDPEVAESLETDPEKYDFAENERQLRRYWEKNLKFQILSRYLSLREEETADKEEQDFSDIDNATHDRLLQQARENVIKSHDAFLKRMLQESPQDHYDRYLDAIARAYDPHTNYLPPTSKEDFDIQMSGSLEGIGATLREDDGFIRVVRVIPGSAAARQGQLEADDIILKVAEGTAEPVEITNTRLRDAVSLIRGKKGTEVRLTLRKPDGRRLIVPIVRDIVEIEESFVIGTTIEDKDRGQRYGYVKIPSFYRDLSGNTERNSTDDTRVELEKLMEQDISGLILDLRNNGGGSLADAVSVTGLFIEEGPVVQVRTSSGTIRSLRDDDKTVVYDGPMIVLVNRFSASASEILAGALQDYGRALIVGDEHTHGKGTVQAVLDLDRYVRLRGMAQYLPLGAAKITIQKFYRISGESTQELGVVPDIILPSRLDGLESGEKYMDNALPWDRIGDVRYQAWPLTLPDLATLRAQSAARVADNEEFRQIKTAAARAQERRAQTVQSLLLADMVKEFTESKEEQANAPHDLMMANPAQQEEGLSREESLRKNLAKDPYVEEGVLILDDILSLLEISGKQAA